MNEITTSRSARRAKARKDKKNRQGIGAGIGAVIIGVSIVGTPLAASAAMWDYSRQSPAYAGYTVSAADAPKIENQYKGTAPVWAPSAEVKAAFVNAGVDVDWEASNRATAARNTAGNANFEMVLVTRPLNNELIKSKTEASKNLVNDGTFQYGAVIESLNWNITTAENIDTGDLTAGEVDTRFAFGRINPSIGNPTYGNGIDPMGEEESLPEGAVVAWANPTSETFSGGLAGDLEGGTADESLERDTLIVDTYVPTAERKADVALDGSQRGYTENVVSCVVEGSECFVGFQVYFEGTGNGSVHLADGTVYASMEEAKGKIPNDMFFSVDDGHRKVAITDPILVEVEGGLYSERPAAIGEQNAVPTEDGGKVWLSPISKAAEIGQFIKYTNRGDARNFWHLSNAIISNPEPAKQTASVELATSAEGNDFRIDVNELLSAPDSTSVINSWSYKVDAQGQPSEAGNYEVTGIDQNRSRVSFGPGAGGVNEAKNFVLTASIADSRYNEAWEVPADLYTGRVVDFNGHKATIKVMDNVTGAVDKYPFTASNTVRFLVSFDSVPEYFSFASDSVPQLSAGVSAASKGSVIHFAPGYELTYVPGTPAPQTPKPAAAPDSGVSPYGTPVDMKVLANDTKSGESYEIVAGSIFLKDADGKPVKSLTIAGEGTYEVIDADNIVRFTPADGFSGKATAVPYIWTERDSATGAENTAGSTAQAEITPQPELTIIPEIPEIPEETPEENPKETPTPEETPKETPDTSIIPEIPVQDTTIKEEVPTTDDGIALEVVTDDMAHTGVNAKEAIAAGIAGLGTLLAGLVFALRGRKKNGTQGA